MARPRPAAPPKAAVFSPPGVTLYHRWSAAKPGQRISLPSKHAEDFAGRKLAETEAMNAAREQLAAKEAAAPAEAAKEAAAPAEAAKAETAA